jgi:catechol 1,2-dioxygenase
MVSLVAHLHAFARAVTTPWYSLDHTYVMERGETVLPAPPIK